MTVRGHHLIAEALLPHVLEGASGDPAGPGRPAPTSIPGVGAGMDGLAMPVRE